MPGVSGECTFEQVVQRLSGGQANSERGTAHWEEKEKLGMTPGGGARFGRVQKKG